MNSINVIRPYKYKGVWVFDDPNKGLYREPFIANTNRIIDWVAKDIPHAQAGFTLLFSATPFPGSLTLDWCESEMQGNWYHSVDLKIKGWLCPSLLRYFDAAPEHLYVQGVRDESPRANRHAVQATV